MRRQEQLPGIGDVVEWGGAAVMIIGDVVLRDGAIVRAPAIYLTEPSAKFHDVTLGSIVASFQISGKKQPWSEPLTDEQIAMGMAAMLGGAG